MQAVLSIQLPAMRCHFSWPVRASTAMRLPNLEPRKSSGRSVPSSTTGEPITSCGIWNCQSGRGPRPLTSSAWSNPLRAATNTTNRPSSIRPTGELTGPWLTSYCQSGSPLRASSAKSRPFWSLRESALS